MNDEAAIANLVREGNPGDANHAVSPETTTVTRSELLDRARTVFGDRRSEFIRTRDPDHAVGLDEIAAKLDEIQLAPLRDAVSIACKLHDVEAPSTIQAWFVGMNRMLGDQAPALVIRDDPEAVRRAAKYFLAYG